MKKVTIVIPNYNGSGFIPECFDALKKQSTKDFDVIVVDNSSEDDSLEVIEKESEGLNVQVIELDNNYGFSRAVNEGIKATDAEYVILLNNDTHAGKRFVEKLVEKIEESEKIFSVQALMLQRDNPQKVDSSGDFFCALGWAFARGKDRPATKFNNSGDIFSSCAGAAIYRKKAFEYVGLFDDEFFAYLEDVDLGYRARLSGYRNVFAPEAKVLHVGSGASGSRYNSFKVSLAARNALLLIYKNFAPWQYIVNAIPVACGIIVKTAFFFRKGFGFDYLKGVMSAFSKMRKINRTKVPKDKRDNYDKIQKELWQNILLRIGL